MKAFPAVLVAFVNILFAQQNLTPIEKMEASGDTAATRAALIRAVEQNPSDAAALTNYAEFLEEYGDPGSRQAYGRLLGILRQGNDPARTAEIAKRLAILNLLAGDRNAATQDLGTYRDVTGKAARIGSAAKAQAWPTTTLPGP
ncbi:MAG TPA: hypothetical protein VJ732_17735, partial [Bryobacteraceae bacterium]|nr:hypothetical protein [Bryobacteraceae bacterium]